jgi:putative ABC transport system permease protein
MKLLRGTRIALRTLGAHKTRTALAVAGIVIGVSAVILMTAIGRGAQDAVMQKIRGLGTNLIIVTAGKVRVLAGRPRQIGNVTTLTVKDAEALPEEAPSVRRAAPSQGRKVVVRYGDATATTQVLGTTPDFSGIRNFRPDTGRFFTDEEVKGAMRVAVLGRTAAANLFADADPLGETVRIKNVPFEVIGVLEEKGVNAIGQDDDDLILVPVTTVMRRVMNVSHVNDVYIEAKSGAVMEQAVREIAEVLRERHRIRPGREDDFSVQNQTDILKAEEETASTFTMLLGSIAAVSLVVGGVGILAVMLISIRERIREIGVRRALGARKRDILHQFLLEALVLSIAGGTLGVALGIGSSFVVGRLTAMPTSVSALSVLVAFLFSSAVGLFFGIYPAKRASELDPIAALRSE